MRISTVMIDFDGTLANTNDFIIKSFQHTYRTFWGREEEVSVIESSFGEPLRVTMGKVFGEAYAEEAVTVYRCYQGERFASLIAPFPGMVELVKSLKDEGFAVALVTSRLRTSVEEGLQKFGLEGVFDAVTTIDELSRHKPDPEAIFLTLDKLKRKPEEAIMVGDTAFDMLCARNAGCPAMLVDWSVMPAEQRREMDIAHVAKDAEDILRWVKGQRNDSSVL